MFVRSGKKKFKAAAAEETAKNLKTDIFQGNIGQVDLGKIIHEVAGDHITLMSNPVADDEDSTVFLTAEPMVDSAPGQPATISYSIYANTSPDGQSRAMVINWRDGVRQDAIKDIFRQWEDGLKEAEVALYTAPAEGRKPAEPAAG